MKKYVRSTMSSTRNYVRSMLDSTHNYARSMLISDFFHLCPQLIGYILFDPPPPEAGAIIFRDDLLCNGTCSVTGGTKRTGGHKREKIPNFNAKLCKIYAKINAKLRKI